MSILCSNAQILVDQINNRWPDRDKDSDKELTPYEFSITSNFGNNDRQWFCDQLIAYARNKIKGSNRLFRISIDDKTASTLYVNHRWNWYDTDNLNSIVMEFSNKNESSIPFDIPILFAKGNQWDGVIPFYDDVELAMQKRSKTTDTYRMACRLSELGFYTGKVLSEGQQGLPTTAITSMQDFMGWPKEPYSPSVHQRLWKELRFSK